MRAQAADVLATADVLVPVPLHRARRRARGFNQAHDLAAMLGPPVIAALQRVRATTAQTALTASARRRNVRERSRWHLPLTAADAGPRRRGSVPRSTRSPGAWWCWWTT